MKKILVALAFGIASITAFAEASFDQIQGLIQQGQYQAAEQGLEVIIKNHPQSAKAFYAMAQAQAGLGNLEKAKKALDIATGLNPSLDFAPSSSVASLKEAITPQTKKIEAVEESHFLRNLTFVGMLVLFTAAMYFLYSVYARKRDEEDKGNGPITSGSPKSPEPDSPITPSAKRSYASSYVPPARPAYRGRQSSVTPAQPTPSPAPASTTTVVNNNSGGNDMLTGVLIGNMISNSGGHHHDNERVVTREVVREVPAPSRDSSWDDTPSRSSSRSSTWDDSSSSSSSKSSSWDDDSSSKSSSSWSSSSSSDSSSSWDSGSSSSSSSSSWD